MTRASLLPLFLLLLACGRTRMPQEITDAEVTDIGPADSGFADTGPADTGPADSGSVDPWTIVEAAIDAAALDDFTLQVGTADGIQFTYSKGDASPATIYLIASASKWLSSAVFMTLVDEGRLSLADRPQDHLSWWTSDPNDPRSRITLEQLLAFTSGLPRNQRCGPGVSVSDCARLIYDAAGGAMEEPGTTFAYGGTHMQVAGAMALAATGAASWNALFREKVADPLGLSPEALFPANPMIAGSARMSLDDYAKFLRAIFAAELLADRLPVMEQDHTPSGDVVIAYSPLVATGDEWHYALGQWRECYSSTWIAECDQQHRISSPGAFGFYPLIDRTFAVPYWLILAREELGGGVEEEEGSGVESVLFSVELRELIEDALK